MQVELFDIDDLVAHDLKQQYDALYNDKEEWQNSKKLLKAFERVIDWYSTESDFKKFKAKYA